VPADRNEQPDAMSAATQTIERPRVRQRATDLRFQAACRWLGGNHTRTETIWYMGSDSFERRVAPYVIDADLPAAFTGCDYAAAPYEYLLHAVASSVITTVLHYANRRGVELETVSVETKGAPFDTFPGRLELLATIRPLSANTRRLVEEALDDAPVLRQLKGPVTVSFA
jgi:uncharacterized OsmC-like protein